MQILTDSEILPFPVPSEILSGKPVTGKHVPSTRLQNELNRIHFNEGCIIAVMRHPSQGWSTAIPIKPLPCTSSVLKCLWHSDTKSDGQLHLFHLECLLLEDAGNLLYIKPLKALANTKGFVIALPDHGLRMHSGRPSAFQAQEISVKLIQNNMDFEGRLRSFWGEGFEAQIFFQSSLTSQWLDPASTVTLMLLKEGNTVYIGDCHISPFTIDRSSALLWLRPVRQEIHRSKARMYRSERIKMHPAPEMLCRHPLTERDVDLDLFDLSSLGFSIKFHASFDFFPVGLILSDLEIQFAGVRLARCTVQVVHRSQDSDQQDEIHCGFAIIEINASEHTRLEEITQRVHENQTSINAKVSMKDLWNFFFQTGFIYPQKYQELHAKKDQLEKVYSRQYVDHPEIARHFIYREKGMILGFMAMLRFYRNCWMIHHHAARTELSARAGLKVLAHLSRFIKNSYMIPSLHLDYVCCFYRQENKFPKQVFGGLARYVNNPQICSVDPFAFFSFPRNQSKPSSLPRVLQLTDMEWTDFLGFEKWYLKKSGGLLNKALDFKASTAEETQLATLYEQIGIQRKRRIFALKKRTHLVAVIELLICGFGLNLSRLTEGLKVFVLDEHLFSAKLLQQILISLASSFENESIPVLLFPSEYAERLPYTVKTNYNLWIMDTQYPDPYTDYISRFLRKLKV